MANAEMTNGNKTARSVWSAACSPPLSPTEWSTGSGKPFCEARDFGYAGRSPRCIGVIHQTRGDEMHGKATDPTHE